MAHSCPDCGQACYCGGDIDDIFLDETLEEQFCTHCPNAGPDDDPDFEADYEADNG